MAEDKNKQIIEARRNAMKRNIAQLGELAELRHMPCWPRIERAIINEIAYWRAVPEALDMGDPNFKLRLAEQRAMVKYGLQFLLIVSQAAQDAETERQQLAEFEAKIKKATFGIAVSDSDARAGVRAAHDG